MAHDAETLVERQKLRRRLLFWRILFVVALIVVGILAFGRVQGGGIGRLCCPARRHRRDRIGPRARRRRSRDVAAGRQCHRRWSCASTAPVARSSAARRSFIALQRVAEREACCCGDGRRCRIGRLHDRHGRRTHHCPPRHHHRLDRRHLPDHRCRRFLRQPRHHLREHQERPPQGQPVALRAHLARGPGLGPGRRGRHAEGVCRYRR